jgi:hypothetical protein
MSDQPVNITPILSKVVEVQWVIPPGMDVYVNHLLAQYDGKMVRLMFAQVNPPVVMGKTETEKQEQLEKISSVQAIPFARFAVPLEDFRTMVEVLQKHLQQIDGLAKP